MNYVVKKKSIVYLCSKKKSNAITKKEHNREHQIATPPQRKNTTPNRNAITKKEHNREHQIAQHTAHKAQHARHKESQNSGRNNTT